jgi:hypothetical protein
MIYLVKSLTFITLLTSSVCAMRRGKRAPPSTPYPYFKDSNGKQQKVEDVTGMSVEENIRRNKTGIAHVCHQYESLAGIYELHNLLTRYSFGGIGEECAKADRKVQTALVDLVVLKKQADGFLGVAETVSSSMWGNYRDHRNDLHFRATLPDDIRGSYRQDLDQYRWRLRKGNDTETAWGTEKFNYHKDLEYVEKTYSQMKEKLRSIGEIFAEAIVYSWQWNEDIRSVFKGISGYVKPQDCGYSHKWDRKGNYLDPFVSVGKFDCGALTELLLPLLKGRGYEDEDSSSSSN